MAKAPTTENQPTGQEAFRAPGQTEGQSQTPLDVTMASLTQQFENIQATFDLVRSQQGLPATDRSNGPMTSRTSRGGGNMTKPHILKPNKFANLPGENFLAWRSQFQIVADYNQWTQEEAKAVAFAHMTGLALESVLDVDLKDETKNLNQLMDEYQNRFLPRSESQMLRTQFNYVVQLPTESVQKLHSRMRVLYHLAYPDPKDRSEVTLIERFIQALNNREVQSHVRRRKPKKYAEALDCAQEETSFVLLDNLTHTPGGPQQPQPGDSSFIGAI